MGKLTWQNVGRRFPFGKIQSICCHVCPLLAIHSETIEINVIHHIQVEECQWSKLDWHGQNVHWLLFDYEPGLTNSCRSFGPLFHFNHMNTESHSNILVFISLYIIWHFWHFWMTLWNWQSEMTLFQEPAWQITDRDAISLSLQFQ